MKIRIAVFFVLIIALYSCAKPLAVGKVTGSVEYISRDYAATPNDVYYALKWALIEGGYPIANENLEDGIFMTAWLPVTSNSHYIKFFGRPDYGVTNSYYQLEVQVVPQGGRTEVKVGSRAKTLASNFKSSGIEERKVLDRIGNRLRKTEPNLTNLGVEE